MGKPVALEASAEEREVRGLISITMDTAGNRVMGILHVSAADNLDGLYDLISLALQPLSAHPPKW